MAQTIDQQFIEFIIKTLASKPDDVKVERSIDEKGVLLELTVAPEDLGRVIGKRGNTAQSIRTLLRALGTKNDARYNLKIVDVDGGEGATKNRSAQENKPDENGESATEEPKADNGADRWAHLSSATDDKQTEDKPEDDSSTESSSVVEKTKKELEDLADLDI